MHRGRMPPRSFTPQREAFLDVHAVEALFADVPAFAQQQHAQAPVAEPDTRLRQLARALAQGRERIFPAGVVHRRSRGLHDPTRPPRADAVPTLQVVHDVALLDGFQNFF